MNSRELTQGEPEEMDETSEDETLWGKPSNMYEQSVYADPIPTPAAKATDAHWVTGLPVRMKHEK